MLTPPICLSLYRISTFNVAYTTLWNFLYYRELCYIALYSSATYLRYFSLYLIPYYSILCYSLSFALYSRILISYIFKALHLIFHLIFISKIHYLLTKFFILLLSVMF